MEQKTKNTLSNIVRWICALPASVIGSWLVYILVVWTTRNSDYSITDIGKMYDSIWEYIFHCFAQFAMGLAFILIGGYIAPSYKRTVLFVLFGIACLVSGATIFAIVITGFNWNLFICSLFTLAGAGTGVYVYFQDGNLK